MNISNTLRHVIRPTVMTMAALCIITTAQAATHHEAGTKKTARKTNAGLPIINGVPWFDQRDSTVSARGANIVEDGGRYYMFGEYKTDSANVFTGFSCYSSDDLATWRFERIALPMQTDGRLGQHRVGERPKVMRCPETGEYVMLMHTDDMRYKDPCVCYATSPTVDGEYTFRGPLLYKGKPIRKWDIGSFQDDDGRGYLLVHHGYIYRLSGDYHSVDSCMTDGVKGSGESPAMFKANGIYYWLSSHTTSWERNDNMYHTANSIAGPWTLRGTFCPEGSLTHNSQTSFVLPLTTDDGRTVPVYMGDRWSFPRQRSAATYVWMPISIDSDGFLSVPRLWQAWDAKTCSETSLTARRLVHGKWQSAQTGDMLRADFNGGVRLAVSGTQGPDCGYARVVIKDRRGRIVTDRQVDCYAKVTATGLLFVSQKLPRGRYTVEISVTGFSPTWTDKSRRMFGSTGTAVRIDRIEELAD